MTEEIIIDGVDVSECKYEYRGYCTIDFEKLNTKMLGCKLCEDNPNCYFKQLKCKEQECKELKKEKAEIKKYLGTLDKTIIQRLEELKEFKDELKISEYNYKQALDSIEKIARESDIYKSDFEDYGYRNITSNILNIINKAKEK